MPLKAVLLDFYGTLAFPEKSISDKDASEFLVDHGFSIYPQTFKAAWQYVSFIDYPKYGYKIWRTYLRRILQRLSIRPSKKVLDDFTKLYQETSWKAFPDAKDAVAKIRNADLKSAVITSIARFMYRKSLKHILDRIDLPVDGYTFHCEKSNPRMYLKTLEAFKIKANEEIMVGNEVELDVLLPKKLGIKAILLDRTGRFSVVSREKAYAIVKNLNEAADRIIDMQ